MGWVSAPPASDSGVHEESGRGELVFSSSLSLLFILFSFWKSSQTVSKRRRRRKRVRERHTERGSFRLAEPLKQKKLLWYATCFSPLNITGSTVFCF